MEDDTTEPESLDTVADRLEAALERIVRHLDNPAQDSGAAAGIAARLDGLIARLRDALSRVNAPAPAVSPGPEEQTPMGHTLMGQTSTGDAPMGNAPTDNAPTGHTPTGHAPTGHAAG